MILQTNNVWCIFLKIQNQLPFVLLMWHGARFSVMYWSKTSTVNNIQNAVWWSRDIIAVSTTWVSTLLKGRLLSDVAADWAGARPERWTELNDLWNKKERRRERIAALNLWRGDLKKRRQKNLGERSGDRRVGGRGEESPTQTWMQFDRLTCGGAESLICLYLQIIWGKMSLRK